MRFYAILRTGLILRAAYCIDVVGSSVYSIGGLEGMKLSLIRKIIGVLLCVFIPLIVIFCIGSILLTTPYINGFVGTIGVMRLELTRNDYIEIGTDPILVLIRNDRFMDTQIIRDDFFYSYFDERIEGRHGIRNGNRYLVGSWGPFTRRYGLIRVEKMH